jgi:Meiotically up-regulated gene 113
MIYFAASGGRIKIGVSQNVTRRLAYINTHLEEPLTLIGTISGGSKVENGIQAHFKQHRLKGEWFKDCEEVRQSIKNFILADKNIEPELRNPANHTFHQSIRTNNIPKTLQSLLH